MNGIHYDSAITYRIGVVNCLFYILEKHVYNLYFRIYMPFLLSESFYSGCSSLLSHYCLSCSAEEFSELNRCVGCVTRMVVPREIVGLVSL